jgi:hypothetical protein
LLLLLLLPLQLPLFVLAAILSEAKDPDTSNITHTVKPFQPQTPGAPSSRRLNRR